MQVKVTASSGWVRSVKKNPVFKKTQPVGFCVLLGFGFFAGFFHFNVQCEKKTLLKSEN